MTNQQETPPSRGLCLVDPCEPCSSGSLDNQNGQLIVYENFKLYDQSNQTYYAIESQLGSGSFGDVYSAIQLDSDGNQNRRVAIKISASDQSSQNAVEYESQALNFVCFTRGK